MHTLAVVSEALQAAESGRQGEENIVELDDVVTAGGSAEEEDDSSGTTPGTIEVEMDDDADAAGEDTAQGDEDSFEIDLLAEGGHYEDGFTNKAFVGKLFSLDLTESSLHNLIIRKVIATFDVEPLDFVFD